MYIIGESDINSIKTTWLSELLHQNRNRSLSGSSHCLEIILLAGEEESILQNWQVHGFEKDIPSNGISRLVPLFGSCSLLATVLQQVYRNRGRVMTRYHFYLIRGEFGILGKMVELMVSS